MPKRNNLVGLRFGRRIVLEKSKIDTYGRQLWCVRCDCGGLSVCNTQHLKRYAGCPNCAHKGPRPYRLKRPFERVYNSLVNRGRHPVLITYEQFVEFTQIRECHYCAAPIRWRPYFRGSAGSASNLDRMDNSKPYELGNIAVCCLRCNKGKNTHFTYAEWRQIGKVIRTWSAA